MDKVDLKIAIEAMQNSTSFFDDMMSKSAKNLSEPLSFSGKDKYIYMPSKELKLLHRYLNLFIFSSLPINDDVVFSYRENVNIQHAVYPHKFSKYFLLNDLKNFFTNIKRDNIKTLLVNNVEKIPVNFELYIEKILNLVCIDDTLAIGFPTSPLISNSLLYEFDNNMFEFCQNIGVLYTRYADDLIFSADKKELLVKIEEHVPILLQQQYGNIFDINDRKTRKLDKSRQIKILGLVILPNGEVTIDRKIKNEIETMIFLFKYHADQWQDKVLQDSLLPQAIIGKVNFAKSVDPKYIDKLRKKYGSTTVDLFMRVKG